MCCLGALALCYHEATGVQTDYAAARDYANRCSVAAGVDPSDVTSTEGIGVETAKWVLENLE